MRISFIFLGIASFLLVASCKGRNGNNDTNSEIVEMAYVLDSAEVVVDETEESGKTKDEDLKAFWSHQLDAFELMGDVHTVRYDSVHLKFNRNGDLEFFGFNDSINLYNNVEYKKSGYYELLREWGDNGWTFTVDSQYYSVDMNEGPITDFTIRDYNNKWLKRYYIDHGNLKKRPDTPKYGEKDYGKNRERIIVHRANVVQNSQSGAKLVYTLEYSNYKYDEYGNWVERLVKSDEEPTKVEKRRITYYSQEGSNSNDYECDSDSYSEDEHPMARARRAREYP